MVTTEYLGEVIRRGDDEAAEMLAVESLIAG